MRENELIANALDRSTNIMEMLMARSIAQGYLLTALIKLATRADPTLKGVLLGELPSHLSDLDDEAMKARVEEIAREIIG